MSEERHEYAAAAEGRAPREPDDEPAEPVTTVVPDGFRPPGASADEPTQPLPTQPPPSQPPPRASVEGNPAFERTPPAGASYERPAWGAPDEALPQEGDGGAAPPTRSGWNVIWPWGMRGMIETIEVLALALLMFLLVRSVAQNFVVDGGSMEPTFYNGEMLIVNKLAYRSFDVSWLPFTDEDDWRPFGAPEPGDVVVFKFPQDQNRDFIKRIVAVSGQTVEVREGKVYIDGVVQNEPYLDHAPTYEYDATTVPEGQLFVLGDNRNNSYDSHSWGLLDESLLIGRAELRYWPFDRIGRIDHGGLNSGTAITIQPEATPSSSTAR